MSDNVSRRAILDMPAHFGPLADPAPGEWKRSSGDTPYGDVHGTSITYLTDARMLSRFLPVPAAKTSGATRAATWFSR
jgi:hypothetical protein